MIQSDLGVYGPDLLAFLKARDVKKRAKKSLNEAKATYDLACSGLEEMRDNFNAAFESSEEPKEWRNYEKNMISNVKISEKNLKVKSTKNWNLAAEKPESVPKIPLNTVLEGFWTCLGPYISRLYYIH